MGDGCGDGIGGTPLENKVTPISIITIDSNDQLPIKSQEQSQTKSNNNSNNNSNSFK